MKGEREGRERERREGGGGEGGLGDSGGRPTFFATSSTARWLPQVPQSVEEVPLLLPPF